MVAIAGKFRHKYLTLYPAPAGHPRMVLASDIEDRMTGFLQNIGRTSLNFLGAIGRLTLFTLAAIRWSFFPPYYLRQLLRQIIDIGYYSLPVVGLTTLFPGMVLALQSYTGFA